ncbi:hypothetical protein ACSVDA_22550 [Cytobacillus sp. Hm23]
MSIYKAGKNLYRLTKILRSSKSIKKGTVGKKMIYKLGKKALRKMLK